MAIPLSFIRELARRLAGTFRRGRSDADLQDELRFHLEMTAESNRRAGEPAKEAARRAAIMCGGVAQAIEAQRDQRGLRWLTDLVRDIHYGWRGLIRRRAITMIAVLSMALGISVTAMVFSLANHVFLRPLPGTDHPEQLVRFRWDGHIAPDPIRFNSNGPYAFSPEVLARLRDRSSSLSSMFAYAQMGRVTASIDGQAEVLPEVEVVSGNYFASLGVHPALGRAITPTDDQPGASPVALISYRYWQSRFASESAVIGKTISVGDVSVTIVGITPLAFAGLGPVGASPAVFVPLGLAPLFQPREDPARLLKGNGLWWVQIGARLRPGAAADQARAHLEPVFQQAALEGASAQGVRWSPRADQVSNGFQTPRLIVEPDGLGLPADESFIDALVILASIAGTVLLVACINLSSLLLSRATVRRKEMGVRLALGAGRGRLLRQLLTESVLLSSLGGLLAVLLLQWTSDLLRRMFGADIEVAFDWRVGGFTGTIAVLSGLCVGAIPALRATQHNISAGLAGGMRDQAGHGRSGWAKGLIVAQIALSLVLLTGAGLLVRTLRNMHHVDPGFIVSQILLF